MRRAGVGRLGGRGAAARLPPQLRAPRRTIGLLSATVRQTRTPVSVRFGIYSGMPTPKPLRLPRLRTVCGVDFSGARLAGRTTWVARCAVVPVRERRAGVPALRLETLDRLETLAGSAEREAALAHLVAMIRASRAALWAVDAPFGLPVEVLDAGTSWTDLVRFLGRWEEGAYAFGLWALDRGRTLRAERGGEGTMHVRRATDAATQAP